MTILYPMISSRQLPLDSDLLCWRCRYNLRGIASSRCPECGEPFDRSHLLSTVIAWERRRYVGRVRTFVRTLLTICFHPVKLSVAIERDSLDLPSALLLRRVTGLILGILLLPLLFRFRHESLDRDIDWPGDSFLRLLADDVLFWVVVASVLLAVQCALAMFDGIAIALPPLFRDAAVASARYACAPLMLLAFPLVLIPSAAAMEESRLLFSFKYPSSITWASWTGQAIIWGGWMSSLAIILAFNRGTMALRMHGVTAARARALVLVLVSLSAGAFTACAPGIPLMTIYLITAFRDIAVFGFGK